MEFKASISIFFPGVSEIQYVDVYVAIYWLADLPLANLTKFFCKYGLCCFSILANLVLISVTNMMFKILEASQIT